VLAAYHGVTERTVQLADLEVLDLGRRRLRAILTPMVHWPETMMTLVEGERVLFTGDVFGSFGALGGGIGDGAADPSRLEGDALRYFANVLGRYSGMIRKALDRVADADPALLVPSHGPIWERVPAWSANGTTGGAGLPARRAPSSRTRRCTRTPRRWRNAWRTGWPRPG
jgi:flavorubredoxin